MAEFLTTTGVSYRLEEIIKSATERLVLISPFLRVNERIKELLEDKDRLKIDVRVIYGKNELQPEENNWLESMTSIRTSFCKNLHAKCYLNENEEYEENHCHTCGTDYPSTLLKPVCYTCYKKYKDIFEFAVS